MRINMPQTGGRGRRSKAVALTAVVAVLLVITACGSSDKPGSSSAGTGSGSSKTEENIPAVDAPEVQKAVTQAFADDTKVADLPETIQLAFRHAAVTLTDEQLDTAFKCWQGTTCDIGDGDVTLGLADGFGQNSWRKFSKMEMILQALTYPQIGKIILTDAQGDLAKYQSNVRSLAAQGAKAIVAYDDFGAAALPAFKAAQDQGAFISAYVGGVPDAPVASLANQVHSDICQAGESMAGTVLDDLKVKGDVAILNGTPGNPQGATWNKCFEDKIKGSDVKVGTKLDTSWTPAGTFKAASALVSSGKDYSAILYDYADPMPQVVQAYETAGKTTPPLITWTSNNGLFKDWEKRLGTDKEFPLYYTNGLNWEARASLTAVMSLLAGDEVPAELVVPQPFVKAEKGVYQADRPDDYPGPSVLVPDSLVTKMLG
jgi:ABC-type sugar transport system substrate-binding protein